MTFSSPSAPALTATLVPRIPIVATGVRICMASDPDLAIEPETKENTPWTAEKAELPSWVSAS